MLGIKTTRLHIQHCYLFHDQHWASCVLCKEAPARLPWTNPSSTRGRALKKICLLCTTSWQKEAGLSKHLLHHVHPTSVRISRSWYISRWDRRTCWRSMCMDKLCTSTFTSTIYSRKLHKAISNWDMLAMDEKKKHIQYSYRVTDKLNVNWNSCFEAFNTFGIENIWWEFVRVKNGSWKKAVLIDIVIGFHRSEFCRMVLPCATGGLTLNIVRYRYGCGSVLNFMHVYEETLFPTLSQCWLTKFPKFLLWTLALCCSSLWQSDPLCDVSFPIVRCPSWWKGPMQHRRTLNGVSLRLLFNFLITSPKVSSRKPKSLVCFGNDVVYVEGPFRLWDISRPRLGWWVTCSRKSLIIVYGIWMFLSCYSHSFAFCGIEFHLPFIGRSHKAS